MPKPLCSFCILIVLLVTGCNKQEPVPTSILGPAPAIAQDSTAVRFVAADCASQRRDSSLVKCGYLSVPKDRAHPELGEIQVMVSIYKSTGQKTSPDPVLILTGGSSSGRGRSFGFVRGFSGAVSERDLILVDLRGSGSSKPSLDCPELSGFYQKYLDQAPYSQDVFDAYLKAQETCVTRWQGQGNDLSSFSTIASAADLKDLRLALNIHQWNVIAMGYGVRVALALLQTDPQGMRSMVADSVELLNRNIYNEQAVNAERALNRFFLLCEKDAVCQGAFPDLQKVFYQVVDDLNSSPKQIPVDDLTAGKRYQVYIDGNRLIDFMLSVVGSGNHQILPEVPRMIYRLKDGKTDTLASYLGMTIGYSVVQSQGQQFQANCVEQLSQTTKDNVHSGNGKADPHLASFFNKQVDSTIDACKKLAGSKVSQQTVNPVATDIPLLVMNGDMNISSSPDWGKQLAKASAYGVFVEFAGGGQSSFGFGSQSDCAVPLVIAFLNDPKAQLDSACAKQSQPITWITLK